MVTGTYRAIIPGPPVPWSPTIAGHGRRCSIRPTTASHDYQAQVGQRCWLAVRSVGGAQLAGVAIAVHIVTVHPRPATASGMHRGRSEGRYPHHVAPDVDKVARNILDGLQCVTVLGRRKRGGGVIEDDARVCRLTVEAWYAAEGEAPHAVVEWGAVLG